MRAPEISTLEKHMHGCPRYANTHVSLDHLIIHCVGVLFYWLDQFFLLLCFVVVFIKEGDGRG